MIVGLKAILLYIVWLILSTQGDFWCELSICYRHLVHVLSLLGLIHTLLLCRYYSQQWLAEVPNRVAPHEDVEVSDMRNKCFRKMFPNPEDLRTIKRQFADFSLFGGAFADRESVEDRALFEPKQWWGLHGQRTPELKSLALKLLGQPASSSSCERSWSTYGFIDSLLRNRLTPPRAEDLVFVHSNMRLLSRKSDDYMKRPTQLWDVGADNHETFTGAGILEHADLSLDEPELEGLLFEDEEGASGTEP
jgi:hypothetical protein